MNYSRNKLQITSLQQIYIKKICQNLRLQENICFTRKYRIPLLIGNAIFKELLTTDLTLHGDRLSLRFFDSKITWISEVQITRDLEKCSHFFWKLGEHSITHVHVAALEPKTCRKRKTNLVTNVLRNRYSLVHFSSQFLSPV